MNVHQSRARRTSTLTRRAYLAVRLALRSSISRARTPLTGSLAHERTLCHPRSRSIRTRDLRKTPRIIVGTFEVQSRKPRELIKLRPLHLSGPAQHQARLVPYALCADEG